LSCKRSLLVPSQYIWAVATVSEKSLIRKLVIQDPHVRLHKVRKTSDEDVLNLLDVEQTVQEVALRFHTVTKRPWAPLYLVASS